MLFETAEERRAHPRTPVFFPAMLDGSTGSAPAVLVDLSISGALLQTKQQPDGTTDYDLHFTTGQTGVETKLRVVRSRMAEGVYYWGCAFADISSELVDRLKALIEVTAASLDPLDVESGEILRDLVRTTRYELRTPIDQIIGYAELLQEQAAEVGLDAFLADLEQIRTAARGLLAWVSATLDLARVAAGQLNSAVVGAEMRTPVLTIAGWCDRLRERASHAWPDALPDIDDMKEAARRLMQLTDSVLQLADFPVGSADMHLPAERALTLQAVARARDTARVVRPAQPATVLVVDANEVHRSLLGRRLNRLGYSVALAHDGFQALDMVRSQPFDLILVDVMLPEMSGADLLEQLKANPQHRDIPVIMLSALDQTEWVAQCIELGAEDYLPKPFEPIVLQARLDASLEKHRLRSKEVEYLREVARVTAAAAAVEAAQFEPDSLNEVAERDDALGQLARVFQRMAREVQAREAQLKQQVQQLRIEIDSVKRQQQVEAITQTDYFQQLRQQANSLREAK